MPLEQEHRVLSRLDLHQIKDLSLGVLSVLEIGSYKPPKKCFIVMVHMHG